MPPFYPSVTGTQWHTLTTWDIHGPRTLKKQDAFQRRSVLRCATKRSGWSDSKHRAVEQLHTKCLEGSHSAKQDMSHHICHMALCRTAEYWMRLSRGSGSDRLAHKAIHSFIQKVYIAKCFISFFLSFAGFFFVTFLRIPLCHICLKAILISGLTKS